MDNAKYYWPDQSGHMLQLYSNDAAKASEGLSDTTW